MDLGSLELQIFVSLTVVLGGAFVALVCDYLKGNNEQLREHNIELRVRKEEQDRRLLLDPASFVGQYLPGQSSDASRPVSTSTHAGVPRPAAVHEVMNSFAPPDALAEAESRASMLHARSGDEYFEAAEIPPMSQRRNQRSRAARRNNKAAKQTGASYADWVRPETIARVARKADASAAYTSDIREDLEIVREEAQPQPLNAAENWDIRDQIPGRQKGARPSGASTRASKPAPETSTSAVGSTDAATDGKPSHVAAVAASIEAPAVADEQGQERLTAREAERLQKEIERVADLERQPAAPPPGTILRPLTVPSLKLEDELQRVAETTAATAVPVAAAAAWHSPLLDEVIAASGSRSTPVEVPQAPVYLYKHEPPEPQELKARFVAPERRDPRSLLRSNPEPRPIRSDIPVQAPAEILPEPTTVPEQAAPPVVTATPLVGTASPEPLAPVAESLADSAEIVEPVMAELDYQLLDVAPVEEPGIYLSEAPAYAGLAVDAELVVEPEQAVGSAPDVETGLVVEAGKAEDAKPVADAERSVEVDLALEPKPAADGELVAEAEPVGAAELIAELEPTATVTPAVESKPSMDAEFAVETGLVADMELAPEAESVPQVEVAPQVELIAEPEITAQDRSELSRDLAAASVIELPPVYEAPTVDADPPAMPETAAESDAHSDRALVEPPAVPELEFFLMEASAVADAELASGPAAPPIVAELPALNEEAEPAMAPLKSVSFDSPAEPAFHAIPAAEDEQAPPTAETELPSVWFDAPPAPAAESATESSPDTADEIFSYYSFAPAESTLAGMTVSLSGEYLPCLSIIETPSAHLKLLMDPVLLSAPESEIEEPPVELLPDLLPVYSDLSWEPHAAESGPETLLADDVPPPPPFWNESPAPLPMLDPVAGVAPAPPIDISVARPAEPEPVAPAAASLPDLLLPTGMHDVSTWTRLLSLPNPMTGILFVIALQPSENRKMPDAKGGSIAEDTAPAVEKLMASFLREGDFGTRSAENEWIFIYSNDVAGFNQRRVGMISEKLWDFQLRHLGMANVSFKWGAIDVQSEPVLTAVEAARDRMNQTRRTRKLPGADQTTPRRAVNA